MTALLQCEDLDVWYGAVQVLFGVDLEVAEGEVLALLGTNGAGKSTLLRAITGLTPPRRGRVHLLGEDITGRDPGAIAQRGVATMPGGRAVFPTLTVADNLQTAGWLFRRDRERLDAAVARVLELLPALVRRLDVRAGLLSGGEQQMLGLAQVLMADPKLLLIDELSLGLAPIVVGELFDVVARLREAGVTIVLVEQSINVALSLATRAVFMEKGRVSFTGPAVDLLDRPDLLRSVFIGAAGTPKRKAKARGAEARNVAMQARAVTKHYEGVIAVDDVDLEIVAGEIIGIIGPNGAGKTTLLDVLSGFSAPDGGHVEFAGEDVTDVSPAARAERGLARTFQHARLFPGLTVTETLAIALERFIGSREPLAAAFRLPAARVSELLVQRRVDELIALLGLDVYRDRYIAQLSTGTRRVVELASLLAQEASVVLLDEPSAGLAQRETEALGPLLTRVRDATGAALVIVEHDVPLLLATCDRLVAMALGRVIADGRPADVVAHPAVVEAYLGTTDAAVARSGARATPAKARRPRRRTPA